MRDFAAEAEDSIRRCRRIAQYSQEAGLTTRTFLSEPMHQVHRDLGQWMRQAGMSVTLDAAGNLRGILPVESPPAATLFIGSHLDTVPHAGAFDGVLGVVLGVKLAELAPPLRFALEVVGFSEEEGVRFGFPFIGSRAFLGDPGPEILTKTDAAGISVAEAIRAFGLDPDQIPGTGATADSLGYLEFHIEQGPVLESLGIPLGIVSAIAGQTRMEVTFEGVAGHAGTTPMRLRRDALAGAAEWIGVVERESANVEGLVATVGRIEAHPGAPNVIAGNVKLSLDIRHQRDWVRTNMTDRLLGCAEQIAQRRELQFHAEPRLDQPAVEMDPHLTGILARAAELAGYNPHRMASGAGHDAMILARRMPAAMLFLRTPGGISHHPDESVLPEDVAAALATGLNFLQLLEDSV